MAVYYVSTDGSDSGDGSIESPFASIQYAHDNAAPGDTIYVRGGVYTITETIRLTNDGTPDNPISILAYGDETPVLDGIGMNDDGYAGYVLQLAASSWNVIDGLEITNGPEGGMIVHGDSGHNVISGNVFHHNGRLSEWEGKGFAMAGTAHDNLIVNNDSHHNRDLNGDNADGFSINAGTGNVLRGNRAWNNSDDGFDLYNVSYVPGTESNPVVLDGNWAWGNGYDDDGNITGDGTGFKLGGARDIEGNTSGGHIVTNNVAWGNASIGFSANLADVPITLSNNVSFDNRIAEYWLEGADHVLTDNLTVTASGQVFLYETGTGLQIAGFNTVDSSGATGDRGSDGSLPDTDFLSVSDEQWAQIAAGETVIDDGSGTGDGDGTGDDDAGETGIGTGPGDTGGGGASNPDADDGGHQGETPVADSGGDGVIRGGDGKDVLVGSASDEVFNGGEGADKIFGKGGDDTFVFDTDGATDKVSDFEHKADSLALSLDIFSGKGLKDGSLRKKFFEKGKPDDKNDFFYFKKKALFYDSNGSKKGGDVIKVVKLDSDAKLTHHDIDLFA